MTIAYRYGSGLYLNITNRCPIHCIFCIRNVNDYHLGPYDLRLPGEPSTEEILTAVRQETADGTEFQEIVFCGMGEPLMRPATVREVSEHLRANGIERIRIDTCGLANLVHETDITEPLGDVVDSISISLNAANAQDYARVCPSAYGEAAFDALLEFIQLSRQRFEEVLLTVVHPNAYHAQGKHCPINVEECRQLARSIGLPLRVRGE